MHKTATAIVMNLVSLIEKYGFVLNEARQYYTNRRVTIVDFQGHSHNLNRYKAMWNRPGQVSSTIDKKSASKFLNISEKQHFYHDIASAVESGWNFSTRWMRETHPTIVH
ncbi:probable trehalase isoform X2 [Arachis hypogaea]|uniref:probable trehalase isoform X2 n=1 Tax=Arachis hypogaea TaxID=3818 RepID=UPI003B223CA0